MINVAIDTETTGLLKPNANDVSEQPHIIELCMIKFNEQVGRKKVIIDEFNELMRPPIIISEEITRITGIENHMLLERSVFSHFYPKIATFMTGVDKLIGHNLPFDRGMLANELIRLDKLIQFPWPMHHYCTIEHSLHLDGHRLHLGELYKRASGQEIVGAHRAKADVLATIACYEWLEGSPPENTSQASA